jgi:hypothetical protein
MTGRPPTVADAFFRQGFGCLAAVAVKVTLVVVVVLALDCRHEARRQRDEADRATASETAARLADGFAAAGTDADGRFVRRPAGPLPDADVWGRPFRLAYHPGTLSDELEVRSAGPDGEWDTRDDVVVTRTSKVATKSVVRDAAGGAFDAARRKLLGKPADPPR